MKIKNAAELMQDAIKVFEDRNATYGDNYRKFGKVMSALFNDESIIITTAGDWNRFGVLIQIVSKLTRYVENIQTGHADSICDMGVYCFMLQELDQQVDAKNRDCK